MFSVNEISIQEKFYIITFHRNLEKKSLFNTLITRQHKLLKIEKFFKKNFKDN